MADPELRELERAWRASRSLDDEVAWLRARLRAGTLDPRRAALAAWFGHEGARALEVLPFAPRPAPDAHDPHLAWVDAAVDALGADGLVRVAIGAARSTLDAWRRRPAEEVGEELARKEELTLRAVKHSWIAGHDGLAVELGGAPTGPAEAWVACPCRPHAERCWDAQLVLEQLGSSFPQAPLEAAVGSAQAAARAAAFEASPDKEPDPTALRLLTAIFGDPGPRDPLDHPRREARHALERAIEAARRTDEDERHGPIEFDVATMTARVPELRPAVAPELLQARVLAAVKDELVAWLLGEGDPVGERVAARERAPDADRLVPAALVAWTPYAGPCELLVECDWRVQEGPDDRDVTDPATLGTLHLLRRPAGLAALAPLPPGLLEGGDLLFRDRGDHLLGELSFRSSRPLDEGERERLLEFVRAQLSDGIGESMWVEVPGSPGREVHVWPSSAPRLLQLEQPPRGSA